MGKSIIEDANFTWTSVGKVAVLCFIAGGLYAVVQSNTTNIAKVVADQTSSNDELTKSIVNLNLTMVNIEASTKNSNEFIKEMRIELKEHSKTIADNHADIMQLKTMHAHY